MRRTFACLTALTLLAVGVTGCGSSPTYQSEARGAIGTLRDAITHYNSAQATAASAGPKSGVAATAQACAQAKSAIEGQKVLTSPPADAPNRKLAHALQQGFDLAIAGFTDCWHAAPYDYSRMAQATNELAQANSWLAVARELDR